MARLAVQVTISVGDSEAGLWCQVCNLPSAVAFKVTMLSESGVGLPTGYAHCTDCGAGLQPERCR